MADQGEMKEKIEDDDERESCREDSDEKLVPKKNATSLLWDYFGFKRDDVQQKTVRCKTCHRIVATTKGNTTNLHSHLKHHHKEQHEEFKKRASQQPPKKKKADKELKQSSISESFSSVTPYESTDKRHKEITHAITFFLAKDMMPIRSVEKEGFVHLIKKLDKRYQIPDRTTFSREYIPNMYDALRAKVKSELSAEVEYFASTTDLWSSRTTEPYMSFTVHYITENFEMKTRCLETAYFPESHTGENIAATLRDVLTSWGLKEEQQICITTDNGANVVKAAELNKWERLQCFGHRLHLAIGKCLTVMLCCLLFIYFHILNGPIK